jgi:cytochrome c oxidase subunit 1
MLFAMGTLAVFIIGGVTGIFLGSAPTDIYLHDTSFVVAHFHYTLFSAAIFGGFAGIYFWFPKMFGRMMNETLGRIHFGVTLVFFNLVFAPMFLLGMGGQMRRIYNPMQYDFLQPQQPVNMFVTIAAIILFLGQIPFVVNFFRSMFAGKRAARNPWQANTLEWVAPSPPPHGNFETVPAVYHGAYVYSSPETAEDWLPQNKPQTVLTHADS